MQSAWRKTATSSEALRLLVRERGAQMLLVTDDAGAMQGS